MWIASSGVGCKAKMRQVIKESPVQWNCGSKTTKVTAQRAPEEVQVQQGAKAHGRRIAVKLYGRKTERAAKMHWFVKWHVMGRERCNVLLRALDLPRNPSDIKVMHR